MDNLLREAARLLRADPSLIGDFLERSGIKAHIVREVARTIDSRHAQVVTNHGDGSYAVRYPMDHTTKPLDDVREANGSPHVPASTWVFLIHTPDGWVFHLPLGM